MWILAATWAAAGCGPSTASSSVGCEDWQSTQSVGEIRDADLAYGVKAAAWIDSVSVFVSAVEPLIRIVGPTEDTVLATKGGGPGEYGIALDIATADSGFVVLDYRRHASRLNTYRLDGRLVDSIALGDYAFVSALGVVGGTRLVQVASSFDGPSAVVRVGARHDTLFTVSAPSTVRVGVGSISVQVQQPFQAVDRWRADGSQILRWQVAQKHISTVDATGLETDRIPLNFPPERISKGDLEAWLEDQIPSEAVVGGDPKASSVIRGSILEGVDVPESWPMVNALMGDPRGGVWVLAADHANGEVWYSISPSGAARRFCVPKGLHLEAITMDQAILVGPGTSDAGAIVYLGRE